MTTLADWNASRQRAWDEKLRKSRHPEQFPNGIECPLCQGNLYDTHQVQEGPPDRIKVKCADCLQFTGWRIE